MKQKGIVVGLIGVGRIGKIHAENLCARVPDVFLKSVVGRRLDPGWTAALNIPVAGADESVVLDDPEIEAVVIATSTPAHLDLIRRAADSGKHVFCEKPIGFDPDLIAEATRHVERSGKLLHVGFNRRFDPDIQKLIARIRNDEVGTVRMVSIVNRDPKRHPLKFTLSSGGLFLDFTIHDFDLLRFITGQEVAGVYACGGALINPGFAEAGDIDTAIVTLKLSDGTFGMIDNSRETHYGYDQRIEVFGSKGTLRMENRRPTAVELEAGDHITLDKPHYSYVERYRESFVAEFRDFLRTLREGKQSSVGGEAAAAAVSIALAAQRSLDTNRPVALSPKEDSHE